MNTPFSKAKELIGKCKDSKSTFLDLGNCGLTNDSEEVNMLSELNHVEELNLGSYYWKDGTRVNSNNYSKNSFSSIPTTLPSHIKVLHMCGVDLYDVSNVNKYTKLERLELSDNLIESVKITCPALKLLGLSLNKITELISDNGESYEGNINDRKWINLPSSLVEIHFMCNDIVSIDDHFFKKFRQLQILDLAVTRISNINFLKNITPLQILYLNEINTITDVKSFNKTIFSLCNLKSINLFNTKFGEAVPFNTTNGVYYRYLVYVELANNQELFQMVEFDGLFDKLVKLPSKKLYSENITHNPSIENSGKINIEEPAVVKTDQYSCKDILIKANFSYASFLILNFFLINRMEQLVDYLDLGNCNLNSSSEEFFLLQLIEGNLNKLFLGTEYYMLVNEPENLAKTSNVISQKLELFQSANTYTPNVFQDAPFLDHLSLTELQMRNCQLKEIPKMIGGDTMVEIDLSNNVIEHFTNLEQFPNLVELALHGNRIKDFIDFSSYEKLSRIYLSANHLRKLKFEKPCKALRELYLYNNEIDEIIFPENTTLTYLYLKGNKIIKAQDVVMHLEDDCVIDLTGNLIDDCPDFVLNTYKLKEIKTYFSEFKKQENSASSTTSYKRYSKLVFLGDTGSGKSAVADYLIGGVNKDLFIFKEWKINDNLIVKIFDFNQEVYENELYHLFLDNDSTYIITWKADRNDTIGKLEFWLDTIKNVSNDLSKTTIFLVQTHVKEYYNERLYVDKLLLEKYNINDIFHIETNLSKTQHIGNFKQRLQLHFHERIINSSIHHNDAFYRQRDKILSLNADNEGKLTLIENNQDLSKDSHFDIVSQFLHNIGYIFKYNDICYKTEIIFDRLSKFIAENIKSKNGIINRDFESQLEFEILKAYNLIINHPLQLDKYLSPKYLPETDFVEDVLLLFEKDAFNDSITIKIPNFYYRKLMDALLIYFNSNIDIGIIHHWKNGLFSLKTDKNNKITNHKILVKGFHCSHVNQSTVRISVQKGEGQEAIYKQIISMIVSLNFRGQKSDKSSNDLIYDALFLERLEFTIGVLNKFYTHEDIRKGIENDDMLFSPFVKYFNYSTNIVQPKKVFISYSHNNAEFMYKLKTHFSGLRRSNIIEDWVDTEIMAGDKWDLKIKEKLNNADVYIMLLSADFIASDYGFEVELSKAIEQFHVRNAILIPIYIQPFDLKSISLVNGEKISSFEILPKKDEKLLAVSMWSNQDEAFQKITEEVRKIITTAKPQRT